MLIIKKFHDYYDTAMGSTGIDKTCVYQRVSFYDDDKYEFVKSCNLFQDKSRDWSSKPYSYKLSKRVGEWRIGDLMSCDPFLIGMCGKTYVGYVFRYYTGNTEEIKITYTVDDFLALMDIKDRKPYSGKNTYRENDYSKLISYYNLYHNKDHKELFVKHHVPIFVYDFDTKINTIHNRDNPQVINRWGVTTYSDSFIMYNPCLKDYKFYKMFNPSQTFQEIQMYLQGVLGSKEKESKELSDIEKIEQHGMDKKWSFRNPMPPKRKQI